MNLEICHSKEHSRHSEGSFVELADGRILFIYTQYRDEGGNDNDAADLVRRIYDNGSGKWSEPEIVVENKAANVMSVSLLRLQSGKIGMMYAEKTRIGDSIYVDCRPWYCISEDEGETWSPALSLTDVPPTCLSGNNDRLVQLKNGNLLYPVAEYFLGNWQGRSFCFISDDEGKTWHRSAQTCFPPNWMRSGLAEPGVIEMADGRIMMWCRTSEGYQYKMFSYDGGETWTDPEFESQFMSPESPLSMKRNPWTGELIAIWNDHDPYLGTHYETGSHARTPLSMAYSRNEGKLWDNKTILESKPDHGYCYTAILFPSWAKGHVLLAYCCGGNGKILNDMKIALVELKKTDNSL